MIFTVELAKVLKRYRLQKNGEWRNLNNDYSLQDNDFQTSNPSEVTNRTPYGCEIEIENVLYNVSPASGSAGQSLGKGSLVFRKDFPDLPSKDQLRSVIASGNDKQMNVLILNLDGKFEIRQRPPFNLHKNDPTVVSRNETATPGNNYIGEDAAQMNQYVDNLFCMFLENWLAHLRTGETQFYGGHSCSESSEQTLKEIELLRSQWTPRY